MPTPNGSSSILSNHPSSPLLQAESDGSSSELTRSRSLHLSGRPSLNRCVRRARWQIDPLQGLHEIEVALPALSCLSCHEDDTTFCWLQQRAGQPAHQGCLCRSPSAACSATRLHTHNGPSFIHTLHVVNPPYRAVVLPVLLQLGDPLFDAGKAFLKPAPAS